MPIKIKQAVIVEGKYDKIKLSKIIDGLIITTDGFRLFKDKEKCALIRTLAETVGLLIITDSDVAGFKIRNYIKSITRDHNITNLYIPQIAGKEKRKSAPSKEGTLGVEGLDAQLLEQLLHKQCVDCVVSGESEKQVTKLDLYTDGFCGKDNSAAKRKLLLSELGLPPYLSSNSLVQMINVLVSYSEYQAVVQKISVHGTEQE